MHSPFVFELVTKCFYNKKPHSNYELIRRYRKKLMKTTDTIKMTDFGAGSRVFSSEERKISAIAWNAGITPKRARLMNRLVRYLNIKNALELGTSVGIGSVAIAAGNKINFTTVEGCPETAKVAEKYFQEFGFENITLKIGEFDSVLDEIANSTNKQSAEQDSKTAFYDLIFIDGNHQKSATLRYFETLLPLVHNDSLVILDDIHWSREMEEAWEEIKLHPAVTLTIDTYYWGLIFFRREQAKEHFVIRV